MSDIFKLNVNNLLAFEASAESLSNLDIIRISDTEYHVLQKHKPFKVEIESANFNDKSYKIKVNDNKYDVNISNSLDLLIKDMGFEVGSMKHVNVIKAPMPGLILDINSEVGQNVSENDTLLILEAMKMENIIASPRDGVIKSIVVEKGEAVEKNQLLIEFE